MSTAIQAAGKRPIDTLRGMLDAAKPSILAVLPKHLSADRLLKVALVACSRNPQLMRCDAKTVVQSVMQAAQLGLDPSGTLGSAYLVPYGTTCQLIVGYRGLVDLARRSGEIETIEAHIVHQADRFDVEFGLNPRLSHVPAYDAADRGPVRLVYAIARLKGGAYQVEVMSFGQIETIRKRAKAGAAGPWISDWDEMARKTVVRRICKYLPLTPELADALVSEDRAESGLASLELAEAAPIEAETVPEPPSKAAALAAKLKPAPTPESPKAEEREPGQDDLKLS